MLNWLRELPWWHIAAAFIVGLLVLPFGFGFMSQGTHRELQQAAVEQAVAPMRAAMCAVTYFERPDYQVNRVKLADLQNKNKLYEVRSEIEDKVRPLSATLTWSETDKCAAIVLSFPQVKAAALESR